MSYLRVERNVDLPVIDDPAAFPQTSEQDKLNPNLLVVKPSSNNRLFKRPYTFLRYLHIFINKKVILL